MEDRQTKDKKNRNLTTSMVVFGVILLLILGIMFFLKNIMPAHLMNKGKEKLEAGQYEEALKMFDMAAQADPMSEDPIYYKALALGKLPPNHKNQMALYEIAQLDDCEKASQAAEEGLETMRKLIEESVGSSYVDNVLYEDQLIRWNNIEPITYYITSHVTVPNEYIETVRNAFRNWQIASGGKITFKEVSSASNSKIQVTFVDNITSKSIYDKEKTAEVVPSFKDDKLFKMDVKIKDISLNGQPYEKEQLLSLAQHEIGHALGLWGHSADENDIMHYSGDYIIQNTIFNKAITQRDINTLLLVYQMVPDVIDIPLTEEQKKEMFYHYILTTYPGENFELETQRLIAQLERDRTNIIVWVDLAINYAFKKQYPRSNQILNRILPLVKTDYRNEHVILYNLAANYYKMGEYEISESYLKNAEYLQEDLETMILESFLDLRMGRKDLAREKLELLQKKHPEHIEISLKLAEIYYSQQDKTKVKGLMEELVRNNPRAMNDRRVQKYRNVKNKK